MNIKFLFIVVFSALITVGCKTHGAKIRKYVRPGMSLEKVKSTMGNPEGYSKIGKYEVYSYYNKRLAHTYDYTDYHYIFKDGELIEYGAGEIRQNKKTGAVFIFSMPTSKK
ncbi:MAG: hypothetical protein U9R36_05525 [Elusimicrobiota bacterium]|nr:hypothetical protein [Elusimicrobiota bacterium]